MKALDPTEVVKGAEKLTAIFGRWPSFHDAEVTSIRFERGCPPAEGPVAYVSIHLFEAYRDAGTKVKYGNHTVATLRFDTVVDVSLRGFNGQNGILDLTLERGRPKSSEIVWQGPAYRVRFQRSFGVGLSFVCQSIEIHAIDRTCPEGSVYSSHP